LIFLTRSHLPLLFIYCQAAFGFCAQSSTFQSIDSLIQAGIESSIIHDYESAANIFKNIIEQDAESPQGYFFMAAMLQSQMIDFETDQWEKEFYSFIDLTINKADAAIQNKSSERPAAQFYKGSAFLYLGFADGRKGEYLSAIKHSLIGISILKQLAENHPDFYDVNFGIGSYNYWRSRMTRLINWLPLISDARQSGIQMVQQATEKGKFTRYAALNELIWILIDAGKPVEAFGYAQQGLEKFPQSRFFLWGAAKSACAYHNYYSAILYFNQILESLLVENYNNHFNEFICRLNLIHCYFATSNLSEAKKQIAILKALHIDPKIQKKLNKQKKRLEQFERKLILETTSKTHDAGGR